MNLFKSELFNDTMLAAFEAGTPRSYRAPAYGQRYGRRRDHGDAAPVAALIAWPLERIGDARVVQRYDRAA